MEKEIKTVADRSIEKAKSKLINKDLIDKLLVVCNIKYKRENLHPNKDGLSIITSGGLVAIPFDEKIIIPSLKFNQLLMSMDVLENNNSNPLMYDIVIYGYVRKDGWKRVTKNNEIINDDGSVEFKKSKEKSKYWIVSKDDTFSVATLDKNGKDKIIKKFIIEEDAKTYIESLSMS